MRASFGGPQLGESPTSAGASQADTDGPPTSGATFWGGGSGAADGESGGPGLTSDDGPATTGMGQTTGAPPTDPNAPFIEYRFDEGAGATVHDSGKGPGYDLTIPNAGAITWQASALRVDSGTLISGAVAATALVNAITASDAFTVEAWIRPSSLGQIGPARILSLSFRSQNRNVTLGQGETPPGHNDYLARIRTPGTNNNGLLRGDLSPIFADPGALTTELTHVVLARGSSGTTTLYIDGALQDSVALPGQLDGWDAGYRLHLAGEEGSDRPWLGTYAYVGIYDRAMDAAEVSMRFGGGPD